MSSPPRPSPATCSCPSVSGSCIGLALVDRRRRRRRPGARRAARRAAATRPPDAFKFADVAVPELIDRVVAAGGRRVDAGGRRWSAARACSRCRAPRWRSARATRPPCATCSTAHRIPSIATETGGDARAHDPRPRRLEPGHRARGRRRSRSTSSRQRGGGDGSERRRPRPERGRDRRARRRGARRPPARGEARSAAAPPHARGRLHAPDQVHLRAGAPARPHAGGVLPHGVDAPVRRAARAARARGADQHPADVGQRPRAGARRTPPRRSSRSSRSARACCSRPRARCCSRRSSCCSAARSTAASRNAA